MCVRIKGEWQGFRKTESGRTFHSHQARFSLLQFRQGGFQCSNLHPRVEGTEDKEISRLFSRQPERVKSCQVGNSTRYIYVKDPTQYWSYKKVKVEGKGR